MSKRPGSEEQKSNLPFLELPLMLVALFFEYPIQFILVVLAVVAIKFSIPHSSTPEPSPQTAAHQVPSAVQTTPVPTVPQVPQVPPEPAVPAQYTIQVGSFESQEKAIMLSRELAKRYSEVSTESVSGSRTLYRVYVGHLADIPSAQQLVNRLRSDGFSPFLVPLN